MYMTSSMQRLRKYLDLRWKQPLPWNRGWSSGFACWWSMPSVLWECDGNRWYIPAQLPWPSPPMFRGILAESCNFCQHYPESLARRLLSECRNGWWLHELPWAWFEQKHKSPFAPYTRFKHKCFPSTLSRKNISDVLLSKHRRTLKNKRELWAAVSTVTTRGWCSTTLSTVFWDLGWRQGCPILLMEGHCSAE